MQYRPGSTKVIEWVAFDGATGLYPQVVVRKLDDDSTIATVNLSHSGAGRYRGSFSLPADTSGLGYFISETIIAYSDSGHTTADANYQIEHEVLQVIDPPPTNPRPLLPTQAVNYPMISTIIEDVIRSELKRLRDDVFARVDAIERSLSEAGEMNKGGISSVRDHIEALFDGAGKKSEGIVSEVKKIVDAASKETRGENSVIAKRISKAIGDLSESVSGIDDVVRGVKKDTGAASKALDLHTRTLSALFKESKVLSKVADSIFDLLGDVRADIANLVSALKRHFTPFSS